jgi:site-specific DNA-methyltransferase (adenine-specific)
MAAIDHAVLFDIVKRLRTGSHGIKFECNPSPFTPSDLVDEICNNINVSVKLDSIGIFFAVEVAIKLHKRGAKNVTVLTSEYCSQTKKVTDYLGYKYCLINEVNMKFDVIVGNPPYQDDSTGSSTKTTNLYAPFFYKAESLIKDTGTLSMIIPSDWIGPNSSSFKSYVFNARTVKEITLHPYKKYFKVKKATCNVIMNKSYSGDCNVTDTHGVTVSLDLRDQDFLSKNNLDIEYRNIFANNPSMSHRWLRGKLNRNQIVEDPSGIEYIEGCGRAGLPMDIKKIDPSLEDTGYGLFKIVMPNVGGTNGDLGNNVKIAEQYQVGGHGVVFLVTNSAQESENLLAYLRTNPIKQLIKKVKTSSPNSKSLFENIPDVDLSIKWNDQAVYKHFNLTQKEIDYVESNS